jgi:hypothetical protein
VEAYASKLERREQALVAKSELQEGRLGNAGVGEAGTGTGGRKSPAVGGGTRKGALGGADQKALRYVALQ